VSLDDYISDVRDLLHDPEAEFWDDTKLTKYINDGRNRVCQDTKCLRQVAAGITLAAGQEQYLLASMGFGIFNGRVIDVMEIDLYYGSTRYPLYYKPWTKLNANFRYWVNNQQRPQLFTRMGALSVYIAPIPDQNYLSDWILAINPYPLIDNNTAEEIPAPFTEPVIYWAAYRAKFGEQSLGEAQIFKNEYISRRNMVQRSFMTFINPDQYAED
jgi:hypothetical protein